VTAALQVLPVQWACDNMVFGAVDAAGCWWIVTSSDGWFGPPKPKTDRQVRSNAPGSFRSAAYRGERVIVLQGTTKCPSVAARIAALDQLATMATDPGTVYELAVTDQTGRTRTISVELDSKTDVNLAGPRWFDWQLAFGCPDPIKYDAIWQQPVSGMMSASEGGLDFSGSGLDFVTSSGLDFGTAGTPQAAQVANFGTERTYPLFEITGPSINPIVTDVSTGEFVTWAGTLKTGDVLTINCAEFPARGFPARSAYFNTFSNRRVQLSVPTNWPSVGPGEVHNFQLSAAGATTSQLTVYLRSAWS
jgi:hypothetical protein